MSPGLASNSATLFDYAGLDPETRIVVQQKTGEIKDRIKRTAQDIMEIGERLIDIKGKLGHGRFMAWLEAEFHWSVQTADNLMSVAKAFKITNFVNLDIAPSALYALSVPSVTEEARKEAIDRAANGHHVSHKEAQEIKEKYKPTPPTPPPSLFFDPEEDADDQRRVEVLPPDPDPEPEETDEEDASEDEEEDSPKVSPAKYRPAPEDPGTKAEQYSRHFLKCLNSVDDLTRSVAAKVKDGGYGGLPAILKHMSRDEALRVAGTVEILVERLQAWKDQITEAFDE